MKIHEYQAKELLAAAGANVPKHIVVKSPTRPRRRSTHSQTAAGSWSRPRSTPAAAVRASSWATRTSSAA